MISVLYVDDEFFLLELTKLYLEKTGDLTVNIAESAELALKQIQDTTFDVIVSDYQMPGMDGIELLKTIRASDDSTPFIIFSGKGREEVVIEAINSGADFYLQKGGEPKAQFAELEHKIRQAVDLHRDRKALLESETRLRALVENLSDIIRILDREGRIVFDTPATVRMLGYPPGYTIGRSPFEFIHPDDLEKVKEELSGVYANTNPGHPIEFRIRKADGSFTWVESIGKNLIGVPGVDGVVVTTRFIDERKQAEEELRASEQRYHNIIEDQTELICRFLPDGMHLFVNEAYARYFGKTRDELIGTIFQANIFPDDRENFRQFFSSLTPDHPVDYIVHRIILADGEVRWLRWSDRAIFDERGLLLEYQSVGRDITNQKKAEEALRKSENMYRTVFENTGTAMVVVEENNIISLANAEFEHISGFSKDEIEGKKIWTEFVFREDLDRMLGQHRLRRQDREKALTHYEFRFITKAGEIRNIHLTVDVIPGTKKSVASLLDITEQKRAEQALQESKDFLNKIINSLGDPIHVKDRQHRVILINDAACRLFNLSREEIIGKTVYELFLRKEMADISWQKDEEVFMTGDGSVNEETVTFAPGKTLTVLVKKTLYTDPAGNQFVVGITTDITERKRIDKELREREAQLQAILQGSPIPKFVIDNDHRVISWNRALEETSGIDAGEILGTSRHWQAFYNHERPCLVDLLLDGAIDKLPGMYGENVRKSAVAEGGYEVIDFFPYIGKSGKWLSIVAAPILDANGTVIGAVETLEDITTLKVTEQSLRESEQRYSNMIEDQTEFICRFLSNGTHVFVNEAYARYFGKRRDEMIGQIFRSNIYPDDREKVRQFLSSLTPEHPVDSIEQRIIMPGGEVRWQWWCDRAIFDDKGSLIEYQSVGRDITHQKQADEALRQANRQLTILNSITRHDILNKVTVLLGYLALVQEQSGDPKIGEYLKKLESATHDIQDQIEFTRLYQDLGGQKPQWQDLARVIPPGPPGITLTAEIQDISIYADPMIRKVFFNLLDNSVRHGQHVTAIRVSCRESEEGLVIVWADNGVGIPLDEKGKVFARGYGENTGLGLFLAREILAITGITIQENGEPGKGAKFELQVPKGIYRSSGNPGCAP